MYATKNILIIAYQLSTIKTILITFRDKREPKTHNINGIISNKKTFLAYPVWWRKNTNYFSNIYEKSSYENGHTYHMLWLVLQCCGALQQDRFCSKASFW